MSHFQEDRAFKVFFRTTFQDVLDPASIPILCKVVVLGISPFKTEPFGFAHFGPMIRTYSFGNCNHTMKVKLRRSMVVTADLAFLDHHILKFGPIPAGYSRTERFAT